MEQHPILREALEEATKSSLSTRTYLVQRVQHYLDRLEAADATSDQKFLVVEAFVRSMVGGLVAFYLDMICPTDQREDFERALLSAARGIGEIIERNCPQEEEEDDDDGERKGEGGPPSIQ